MSSIVQCILCDALGKKLALTANKLLRIMEQKKRRKYQNYLRLNHFIRKRWKIALNEPLQNGINNSVE